MQRGSCPRMGTFKTLYDFIRSLYRRNRKITEIGSLPEPPVKSVTSRNRFGRPRKGSRDSLRCWETRRFWTWAYQTCLHNSQGKRLPTTLAALQRVSRSHNQTTFDKNMQRPRDWKWWRCKNWHWALVLADFNLQPFRKFGNLGHIVGLFSHQHRDSPETCKLFIIVFLKQKGEKPVALKWEKSTVPRYRLE